MKHDTLLEARDIEFGYNAEPVLQGTDIVLNSGDLVGLLGPNGSGKTTLLKILCGILGPRRGTILVKGRALGSFTRRELAREIGLVPQDFNVPFAFTVSEIVGLGRTPHMRPLRGETRKDREAVARALELTETLPLAERYFGDLSGGEAQRVVIAMALAQVIDSADPSSGSPILLLDEPTVHLDLNHQIQVLELIRNLNRERGLVILATMHDLNLASLYFDRLVLLDHGRIVTDGTPGNVITKSRIENTFRTDVVIQPHPTRREIPQVILVPTNGNGKHKE